MTTHGLTHAERLRSLGAIRRLFEHGQSGFVFPFRYVWYAEPDTVASVEVLFSVPKKFHKRANKRNLLRRRAKEAYRLHKTEIFGSKQPSESAPSNIDLALIYSSKEVLPYKSIDHAIRRILEQIGTQL